MNIREKLIKYEKRIQNYKIMNGQLVEEIRREDFRYVVQICMNIPEDSTDYYYLANKKVLGNCRWEGCERYV